MAETIALLQKISTVSFGVLVGLLLFGSYFEIWVWGRQFREAKAELRARLDATEHERDEWKHMALSAAGIAESATATVTTIARRREK